MGGIINKPVKFISLERSDDNLEEMGITNLNPSKITLKRYNSNTNSKDRSIRSGNSENNSFSIRGYALANHSRHKETYIPYSILTSDSAAAAVVNIQTSSSIKISETEPLYSENSVVRNDAFRRNLGLTININNEKLPVDHNLNPENGNSSKDDDEEKGMTPFLMKIIPLEKMNNKLSFVISQTGSIEMEGLEFQIGTYGIISNSNSTTSSAAAAQTKLDFPRRVVILCKLGQGASGIVYKALDLLDMKLVALKVIPVTDRMKRLQLVKEVFILYKLMKEPFRAHSVSSKTLMRPEKYLVDFFDAFSIPEDGTVCLMLEYLDGGSLQDIVDRGGCKEESTLANIASQVLKGLFFLHNNQNIHRDVKPSNLLISQEGRVKVADLGLLKNLGGLSRTNSFVGTASFMSPERLEGSSYDTSADIWSLGISLITIATGLLPPGYKDGFWSILQTIREKGNPVDFLSPELFSDCFRDFVNCCLHVSPADRSPVNQLLLHPFVVDAIPEVMDKSEEIEYIRKEELSSILVAIHAHIEFIKSNEFNGIDNTFFDLDINSTSTVDILKVILFGSDYNNTQKRHVRPRLVRLARQVYLPLETVMEETNKFLVDLENSNSHWSNHLS